jgi:hypothetical protein
MQTFSQLPYKPEACLEDVGFRCVQVPNK